jgi:integrase
MTATATEPDQAQAAPAVTAPIPGMHEASIRAAIAQLQALLPERAITLRELWDRYATSLPNEKWTRSVKSTVIPFLKLHGDVQVAALSPRHWFEYRDAETTRERFCVSTRNQQLFRIRVALNWAVETERVPYNPLEKVKPEKAKPKRETVISREDEQRLLEVFDPLMKAFFLVSIDTAMRKGEVRTLHWGDIDFDKRTIHIPAARTKTKRARTVQFTSRAGDALAALPRVSDYVFANPETKTPYCDATLWDRWRAAADGLGMQPAPGDVSVRWHDIRGSAASRLMSEGATLPAVQQILGHTSIKTTAVYVRVDSRDVIEAYRLLEDATRKPPQRAPGNKSVPTAKARKKAAG